MTILCYRPGTYAPTVIDDHRHAAECSDLKAHDRMNTNYRTSRKCSMRCMMVQLDSAPSAAESETKLGSKDKVTVKPLDSDTTI